MLRIPGQAGKDNCDKGVGPSRRDILRVGGSAMMGMSLGQIMNFKTLRLITRRLVVVAAGIKQRASFLSTYRGGLVTSTCGTQKTTYLITSAVYSNAFLQKFLGWMSLRTFRDLPRSLTS